MWLGGYTVRMYSKVKQLRQRGTRRSDREIGSDAGTVGHLTLIRCNGHYELKLHAAGDDSRQVPMLPVLFDAAIVSMHGARMLFCGFERQGDQADRKVPTAMQEWAVEVMAEPPNEASGLRAGEKWAKT